MNSSPLNSTALEHLSYLCNIKPHRRVGGVGNRAATVYYARVAGMYGFKIENWEFNCQDWESGEVSLSARGLPFDIIASGHSLGCEVKAPLCVASSFSELEAVDAGGKIILVKGELAAEQLMPKNFTFYNPEHHQRIIALLERKAPLAIVASTGHNPELAGALYPFPLIEDGDFNIPVAHMKDVDGDHLAACSGEIVELVMEARRIPTTASQIVARKGGNPAWRFVICGHIDTKASTPGALDNASGVTVQLLLAELLRDYTGQMTVELVPFNGEDHYSAAGQKQYVSHNEGHFGEIQLAVNLDGLGWKNSLTAYSLYDCPEPLDATIRAVFSQYPELVEGPSWPQSDHMIFVMNGVPAAAITTREFARLEADVAHTEKDIPRLVDPRKLVIVARALAALIAELNRRK